MAEAGFDCWYPMDQLSVFGYLDALRRLPALLAMRRNGQKRWLAEPPAAFVGIDAPDFNLGLERKLREHGIPTVHFVGPSIWAWRGERIHAIRKAVSHMLVVFPLEVEIYREAGVPVSYVGHPLARVIPEVPDRAAARERLGVSQDAHVLAVMPGSRAGEIAQLGPRFLAAVQILHQQDPLMQFLVPMVNAERQAQFEAMLPPGGIPGLRCIAGGAYDVMEACDVALVASGTATLETALFKRPMVIAYAMPAFSYRLMRGKRQLPWVGLPNVLCAPPEWLLRPAEVAPHDWADRPGAPFVVPELIQHAATPQALAAAVLDWLAAPERIAATAQRFAALHQQLQRDTAQLATDAIETLLAR